MHSGAPFKMPTFHSAGDNRNESNQITPHKISLLVLIKTYADIYDGKSVQFPRMVWLDEWSSKRHLDRYLLSWIHQPDGSMKDVLKTVSLCSKVLHTAFVSALDTICNGTGTIEDLNDFMSSLESCLTNDTVLDKRGLLGIFCRRMLIYFKKLSFCEVHPLLDSFVKYCAAHTPLKTAKKLSADKGSPQQRPGGAEGSPQQQERELMEDMELESQSEMDSKSSRESMEPDLQPSDLTTDKCEEFEAAEFLTRRQADYFFMQQTALMEGKESSALPPAALQKKLRDLLKNNPDLTLAHYVSYLNNLRLRDYSGAIDSLFMYFIRHNPSSSSAKSASGGKSDDEDRSRAQRFATLNLALLHERFGHTKQALAVAREAIDLAQLSNDQLCLQHATAFLNYLQPGKSLHNIVDETIKPALKDNLSDVAYSAIQSYAKRRARQGRLPSATMRMLAATDALRCTRLTFATAVSPTLAHKAALWAMHGKRRMAILYCQLALSSQPGLDTKTTRPTHHHSSAEEIVLCLSHLAQLLDDEGNINSSYDLLNHLKTCFPPNSKHSHIWRRVDARLNHQDNVRLRKFTEAAAWESALLSIDRDEALYRQAENLTSRDENVRAHSILAQLLNKPDGGDELEPDLKCQVLMLMAKVLSQNTCENSSSMKYTLQALVVSHQSYLHHLFVQSMLLFAQLQLQAKSPAIAIRCLKSIKRDVVTCCSFHTRSKFITVAARCLVKQNPIRDGSKLVDALHIALKGFHVTEDVSCQRDTVYLLATVWNKMLEEEETSNPGDVMRRRNSFATEFKRLDVQLGMTSYKHVI